MIVRAGRAEEIHTSTFKSEKISERKKANVHVDVGTDSRVCVCA
jgi:hypothetical protein